jgi:hypothetical protein
LPVSASSFHRLFLHLALLAVTLLALVPTTVRLIGADDSAARWVELCTATGSTLVDLQALDGDHPSKTHGAEDCDYCLLGGKQLPMAVPAWTGLHNARGGLRPAVDRPAPGQFYPLGLGSRGPPLHS